MAVFVDREMPAEQYKMLNILGHDIRVYDEGSPDATTLFIQHGAPHSSAEYRFNVPAFVEAGYRVVIHDYLGTGGSARPTDVSQYSAVGDYDRSLAVADALGLDKFYVIGGDRGSVPMWRLAALNPERVLGVVSENMSHVNGINQKQAVDQWKRSWYMWFFLNPIAKDILRDDDWALAWDIFEYHPDVELFIRDWERPNGLEGSLLNWYTANIHPEHAPKWEPLPNVSAPVLIVYTMNDLYTGLEQLITGREFLDGPVTTERIAGAGHFVARNAPERYNNLVLRWLASVEKERNAS